MDNNFSLADLLPRGLVPAGSVYDGSFNFIVPTTPGATYFFYQDAADEPLLDNNGTPILASGLFIAAASFVTIEGNGAADVTSNIYTPGLVFGGIFQGQFEGDGSALLNISDAALANSSVQLQDELLNCVVGASGIPAQIVVGTVPNGSTLILKKTGGVVPGYADIGFFLDANLQFAIGAGYGPNFPYDKSYWELYNQNMYFVHYPNIFGGAEIGGDFVWYNSNGGVSNASMVTANEAFRIKRTGGLWVAGELIVDTVGNTYISSNYPATAGSAGAKGQIATDGSYFYVCTATNTWKRVAIATF